MEENGKEVIIDTEEIAEFIYKELIERGYAPEEEEIEEIADIVFDFLIEKQALIEGGEDEETEEY